MLFFWLSSLLEVGGVGGGGRRGRRESVCVRHRNSEGIDCVVVVVIVVVFDCFMDCLIDQLLA